MSNSTAKLNITVHMVVKNEDQWIRYSILSVLPYVSQMLICDTGSSDHTIDSIKSINSPKIKLTQTKLHAAQEISDLRQSQLHNTQEGWVLVLDGDEIYPKATIKELLHAMQNNDYEGICVRRYDLLGDIYHRQAESVGSYHLYGQKGHLVLRALNLNRLKNLTVKGDYPLEGYYDRQNIPLISHDPAKYFVTDNYLFHAMYLQRSSLGGNLKMFNRHKNKLETGINLSADPPEVFVQYPPLAWEASPLKRRSLMYSLGAALITPLKSLKRKIWKPI